MLLHVFSVESRSDLEIKIKTIKTRRIEILTRSSVSICVSFFISRYYS